METTEYFLDFLRRIGATNFLSIGIIIILLWLLTSGLRRGLKKRGRNKRPNDKEHNDEDLN